MNTLENIFTNPEKNFTVNKKDINNNQALLPNALYTEMELFVKSIISNYKDLVYPSPQLFKLQILKNAYLNDKLIFESKIKRLDQLELHISVLVKQKNKTANNLICKAIFKLEVINTIQKAS